ncbi:MAG: SMI1/KNR4 family protein [Archangium sp.]|nr:SMI1/KNR4 family protein [Archangium sp.]
MTIDWPALIGRHVLVQQQITELDAEALWGHELPGLAASPAEVAALETQTGRLPDAYREFLLAANGWPAFHQWVDLFSVAELMGERRAEAHQLCAASWKQGVFEGTAATLAELLPIGSTRPGYRDLAATVFVLGLRETRGTVYWLGAHGLVDTFPSFTTFFASMTEYGLEEVGELERQS